MGDGRESATCEKMREKKGLENGPDQEPKMRPTWIGNVQSQKKAKSEEKG